jgi:hypothetical protein
LRHYATYIYISIIEGENVGVTRYNTVNGGKKIFSPVLKVPRQCPHALLVEVRLREGKAYGSENGKRLGCGLCYY